jgi:predicted PurR-regulated permease PerM
MNYENSFRAHALFYNLGTIVLIIFCLMIGRPILVPMAWALFFSFLILPIAIFLERKGLRRSIAIIISLLILIAVLGGVFTYFGLEITAISRSLSDITSDISRIVKDIKFFLSNKVPLISAETDLTDMMRDRLQENTNVFFSGLSTVGNIIMYIGLMPIFIYFILYYRDLPNDFVMAKYEKGERQPMKNIFKNVQLMIRNYLQGTMWFTIATAVMDYVILLALGIRYALFFAILVAILNLIPYVGNLLAFIIVFLYALATSDSIITPLLAIGLLWAANMVQENVIRPWLIGTSTNINAFVILLSVIIGGLVWGVSGMILFIPLVGVIKIILEEVPDLKPYAIFLSDPKKKGKKEQKADEVTQP